MVEDVRQRLREDGRADLAAGLIITATHTHSSGGRVFDHPVGEIAVGPFLPGFYVRARDGWGAVGMMLIVGHFLFPFAFLMSRNIKRNGVTLAFFSIFLLVIHCIDMQFLILPGNLGHGHAAEAVATTAHEGMLANFMHQFGEYMHTISWADFGCFAGLIAIMAGLMPILWAHGTGSEIMQRIAVPMIGGMVSSTLLTLILVPVLYELVERKRPWSGSDENELLRLRLQTKPAEVRHRLHQGL